MQQGEQSVEEALEYLLTHKMIDSFEEVAITIPPVSSSDASGSVHIREVILVGRDKVSVFYASSTLRHCLSQLGLSVKAELT